MSEVYLKREIRSLVKNSSCEVDLKMLCPIVKIMNMKYKDIDNSQVRRIASEIITQKIMG